MQDQHFEIDFKRSTNDFVHVVLPSIIHWFDGCEIIPVECIKNSYIARIMDMNAGIDALLKTADNQLMGISNRIQWAQTPYDSFTIRYKRDSGSKTEYEKLQTAISTQNYLWPQIFIHSYIDNETNNLMSCSAISMKHLIKVCESILNKQLPPSNEYGIRSCYNAHFFYINWDWLKENNAPIVILRKESKRQMLLSNFV